MTNKNETLMIYGIGYQLRLVEQLIDELLRNKIELLVDLRERPQSRKPGYSSRQFPRALGENGINYEWMGNLLGGFNCTKEQWSYGSAQLKKLAQKQKTCVMCLEHDVEDCHRRHILDIMGSKYKANIINL